MALQTDRDSTKHRSGIGDLHCSLCKKLTFEFGMMEDGERVNCMPFRPPKGRTSSNVLLVGEAPGKVEAVRGVPFCGRAGQFLEKELLHPAGISTSAITLDNAVKCRPLNNRTPTASEVVHCRPYLVETVKKTRPRVIVATGAVPWLSLTGLKGIVHWQGHEVWSREFGCWILPVQHPAGLLRLHSEYENARTSAFLGKVEDLVKRPPPECTRVVSKLVRTDEDVQEVLSQLRSLLCAAVDTETTSIDTTKGQLLGVAVAFSPKVGYFIPVGLMKRHKMAMREAFTNLRSVVMHNSSYDVRVLQPRGFVFRGKVWDTMLMHHLLDENFHHGLKELAWRYTGMGGYDNELEEYKKKHKVKNYGDIPLVTLAEYAACDAAVMLQLKSVFAKEMVQERVADLYDKVTEPARKVLTQMELRGAPMDVPSLKALDKKLGGDCTYIERGVVRMAARKGIEDLNIRSNPQLQYFLFKKLRLKPLRKTKTGFSTDGDTLEGLKDQHPVPALLSLYRKLEKYRATYVQGTLEKLDGERIHTNYLLHGQVAGRPSSSSPNLNNVPRDKDIRTLWGAPKGRKLIEGDYGQAELRILAMYAKDKAMLEIFSSGGDLHRTTAAQIFGIPPEKVTKEQRWSAKAVNFGLVYGLGASSLAEDLGCSVLKAEKFISDTLKQFPQVREFIREVPRKARRTTKSVRSLFGRVRRIPELDHDNLADRGHADRQAVNSLIQGTASDCMLLSLARIHERLLREKIDAYLVLTVYDCVVVESAEESAEYVAKLVKEEMERPIKGITVPMVADTGIVDRWGEHGESLGIVSVNMRDKVKEILDKFRGGEQ